MSVPPLAVVLASFCLAALGDHVRAPGIAPDSAAPPSSVLADLKPGGRVRLTAPPVGRLEGSLQQVDADAVQVEVPNGRLWVQLADIDSLWVRERHAGFLIGWVTTSAALAIVEYSACSSYTDGNCGLRYLPVVAATSALVGVLGGGVGAAIGEAARPWRRRIP